MPKRSSGGRIPIAKSTGLPDRRYSTDGRHSGGGGGGIPIAKSTGLPDRRYSTDGRHSGVGGGGIPIAKSTGQPDRRYSSDGRYGGSGIMAAATAEAAAAVVVRRQQVEQQRQRVAAVQWASCNDQQRQEENLRQLDALCGDLDAQLEALQQQMRDNELYYIRELREVLPQDLFRVHEDQREDVDDDASAAGSSMLRRPVVWPQPLDIPRDMDVATNVPQAFVCRISHEIMREPALVCLSGHTYDRVHLHLWHASSSGREPLTRQPFELTDVVPNLALRELIDEWIQEQESRQLEEEAKEEGDEDDCVWALFSRCLRLIRIRTLCLTDYVRMR